MDMRVHTPLGRGADVGEVCGHCCSAAQSCPTLCDPTYGSVPGFPALHSSECDCAYPGVRNNAGALSWEPMGPTECQKPSELRSEE